MLSKAFSKSINSKSNGDVNYAYFSIKIRRVLMWWMKFPHSKRVLFLRFIVTSIFFRPSRLSCTPFDHFCLEEQSVSPLYGDLPFHWQEVELYQMWFDYEPWWQGAEKVVGTHFFRALSSQMRGRLLTSSTGLLSADRALMKQKYLELFLIAEHQITK